MTTEEGGGPSPSERAGRRDDTGVDVDLVELTGVGGPYQHSVALAEALAAQGVRVVLHTATDRELEPGPDVEVCPCVDWRRGARRARRARVAIRFVVRTAPHLWRRRAVTHVEGPAKPALLAVALAGARLRARRTVFSPHNTFSRRGNAVDARLLRLGTRLAHVPVVFSRADAAIVEGWGASPLLSPLLKQVPPEDPEAVQAWRQQWGAGPVVLFAGQVRPDKRLDLVIEASRHWTRPARLAVVGADHGDGDRCRRLAEQLGVDVAWSLDYFDLDQFAAAIRAADVLVCPYTRASQSGVVAQARQMGVRSVATDVGGVGELASIAVPGDVDAVGLAAAVDAVLAEAPPRPEDDIAATVAAHLHAYGLGSDPVRR